MNGKRMAKKSSNVSVTKKVKKLNGEAVVSNTTETNKAVNKTSTNDSSSNASSNDKPKCVRDAIQKQMHSRIERKRKARMTEWIQKINMILPKDQTRKKDTILRILERNYEYLV